MSQGHDVLGEVLMRSSTPGHEEKVRQFLQTMDGRQSFIPDPANEDNPDWNGAQSQRGHEDGDDIASNIQEQSEGGHYDDLEVPVPPHRMVRESHGSSFGNLGPLPPNNYWEHQRTPALAAGIPLPESVLSPRSTSYNIAVQSPSRPDSKQSSRTNNGNGSARPIQSAKTESKAPTEKAHSVVVDPRPMSPMSTVSKVATQRSRAQSRATEVPPTPTGQRRSPNSQTSSSIIEPRSPTKVPMPAMPARAPSRTSQTPYSKAKSVTTQTNSYRPPRSVADSERTERSERTQRTGLPTLQNPHRPNSPQMFSPSAPNRLLSPTQPPRSALVHVHNSHATPSHSHAHSLDGLNETETQLVRDVLMSRTPRTTSYAPTTLESELQHSHFHDQDLCILLHAADDPLAHDVVKKAVRKAVKARMKKLSLKYDHESIKMYRKSFHNHDPSWHNQNQPTSADQEMPPWARDMIDQLALMEQRVAALGPKIDSMKSPASATGRTSSHRARSHRSDHTVEPHDNENTPRTQTVPLDAQFTGTVGESMYRQPDTEFTIPAESTHGMTNPGSLHHHDGSTQGPVEDEFEDDNETQMANGHYNRPGPSGLHRYVHDGVSTDRGDSPGKQFLEEQLYKLRVKEPDQSAATHQSWEITRDDELDRRTVEGSELPEIAGSAAAGYDDMRSSPPLPPLPAESRDIVPTPGMGQWDADAWNQDSSPQPAPWQRIHQRLLNWAIVWSISELDVALNSTERGSQVHEVALTIWSTQQYKRYVRQQLTEVPPKRVDRLFVPPNMADAINNAVFHGRHGDACGMLRDLWAPFGLEGIPRIIIVLCKHRSDSNHWVAHKFSLPEGTLTTFDTYPERCLPDGRPLGWWFAIRIAWPGAMYPSPDHLMQKMVRLHRPMQLGIENSVAAAGIWRNLLMSSRAERPVDLDRLRDLINTEVKNLRQRKEQGKLFISAPRPNWEDLAG